LIGLIDAGTVPYLFVEGGYNQRLDTIADPDIPAASSYWSFDKTDMQAVKRKLGGWATFGGNVPNSMLHAGTPEQVTACVIVYSSFPESPCSGELGENSMYPAYGSLITIGK
jgi:hypothetical protein